MAVAACCSGWASGRLDADRPAGRRRLARQDLAGPSGAVPEAAGRQPNPAHLAALPGLVLQAQRDLPALGAASWSSPCPTPSG